jgi:23S rRNA (cytosine1962-C5)-methyltransferase
VQVLSAQKQPMGQAFCNPKSKIVLRWLTDEPSVAVDRDFWKKRLRAAFDYRKRVVADSTAYRLVHAEADGFPGLVIDKYDSVLSLQSQSLAMEPLLPLINELLTELLKPKAIIYRNDAASRKLEGLPLEKKVAQGTLPEVVEIQEGNRRYTVRPMEGHKTGAYLDQRENRIWARQFARGRVLDAFAYQGGFTLQVSEGAKEILALEDSAQSAERLKENLTLNKIKNVQVERANAFDRLRELEKEAKPFDLIILDPPAFAKSRGEMEGAWRGYRDINLRAMRLLVPGGTLITCSCSHQISDEIFGEILREAAADSKRRVRLVEQRTQSADHPVLLTHPESKYLKCFALEIDP